MLLKLENIGYTYQNTQILDGINLEIKEGECISVIGSSGSGKSTLLKLCSDLIMPTVGSVLYKGKDYKGYEPTVLRKEIGYCVQTPYLFGETVKENLYFPFVIRGERVEDDKINELMKTFKLEESYLGKSIHNLSGGEKQRIALIRSLIFPPKVLLLDEVTASLDQENTSVVEAFVKKLNASGITILWVTHNEKQSESIFTRRITMKEGKVIQDERLYKEELWK